MAEESTGETEAEEVKIFSLPIHEVVDRMQLSYGLRHEDYGQYHAYCTRRLGRLRHHRGVHKALVHSADYVTGEKRRKNVYCPRESPAVATHENMFWVLVVGAERAWAQAQQLKSDNNNNNNNNNESTKSSPAKIRQHALRRLRKARKLSIQMEELCQKQGDEMTQQEAQAYASWMKGNVALEVADWKTACTEFQLAMRLYRALADRQGEDELEKRDLFSGRATNTVKPLFKYCLYELGESGGDPSAFEEDTQDASAKQGDKTSKTGASGALVFRGHELVVDNKSLKVLLLKAEGLTQEYNQSQQDKDFVSLLSAHDDAIAMVTAELKKYQHMKAGPAVDAKKVELELWLGYLQNEKLQLSIKRMESRIQECRKETELAHLYDALLQDVKAVCDLPGPEQEDEFLLEANANVLRVRAFRAYYVAQLYSNLNKTPEALALLKQADLLSEQASEEIAACEGLEEGDAYLDALDSLRQDIVGSTVRMQVRACMGGSTGAQKGDLLSNLDSFTPSQTWVDLATLPVPCKPSFFDIAWNHASQFPLEELQNHISERQPKRNSGFFGWFG